MNSKNQNQTNKIIIELNTPIDNDIAEQVKIEIEQTVNTIATVLKSQKQSEKLEFDDPNGIYE